MCDALFVHSEDLQNSLSALLGPGHPPIFVTPHGVWSVPTNGTAGNDEHFGRRHLLYFGVVRRYKGVDVLLRAMKLLPDCTLTIAGAPEERSYQEQIRRLTAQLPPEQVDLIEGYVEQDRLTKLFGKSSLVVLPYRFFAAQSGVLHDALAYGLPVVVTDVGALGESVQRWGIGQVVPPNDATALARAIREMLTPGRYAEAKEAVHHVRADLSWTRTAEATVEGYRSAELGTKAAG
jgi:glycosyltransferase involved in cell wall biosynthesis